MLIFIKRHNAAAAGHLTAEAGLFHIVTGLHNAIFVAPVVELFGVILEHQRLHGFPVAVTELAIPGFFHKQKAKACLLYTSRCV